jgi:bifunctional enzyme CysN/CysC
MDVNELLRRNRDSSLLRFVTIGSVDDGKSTLIGRLLHESKSIYEDQLEALGRASSKLGRQEPDLALLTDGLRAEREGGITIDVAYRYFSTPKRRFIIADCPGHEQYTRNMVTGASTADLALLLVDASQGILPQSKRHAFIASLLAVPHVIVCINKMDLVDYSEEVYEQVKSQYQKFSARLNIGDLSFLPVSALKGDNVLVPSSRMPWYHGEPLLEKLEEAYTASDRNLVDLRMPVQYVLRPDSDFRGYCGRLASGILRTGDEIAILPSGLTSRVKKILGPDGEQQEAVAGQSITVELADELDVGRGDLLVHPANQPRVAREAEAMLVWMSREAFRPGRPYIIKQAAKQIRCQFTRLHYRIDPGMLHREEASELQLNEIGRVAIEFYQSIAFDQYSRNRTTGGFVVIDPASNETVGAGMIIERGRGKSVGGKSGRQSLPVSSNITSHAGLVSAENRAKLFGHPPVTIWLTGLSGSGKSTIAQNLEKRLIDEGRAVYLLDGDNTRAGLNSDLGFSAGDRTENIRRVAEVAGLFNDAGLIAITAFISPYIDDRQKARERAGEGRFIEVFVDAPLETCESRDPKGLYKKARSGEIASFTGISAPYEAPPTPEIHLNTSEQDIDQCVEAIIKVLQESGVV